MQTDAQPWMGSSQFNRLRKARFVDHHAGRGEDPLLMSQYHRFIDGGGTSEIVGVYNEPPGGSMSSYTL